MTSANCGQTKKETPSKGCLRKAIKYQWITY